MSNTVCFPWNFGALLKQFCVRLTTFLYTLFKVNVYCIQSNLVRMTENGPVQGIEKTSALGQKYYSFRGVPFAAPPITGVDPYTGLKVDRRFKVRILGYFWTSPNVNLNDSNLGTRTASICSDGAIESVQFQQGVHATNDKWVACSSK